jgi:hypothetical protein
MCWQTCAIVRVVLPGLGVDARRVERLATMPLPSSPSH